MDPLQKRSCASATIEPAHQKPARIRKWRLETGAGPGGVRGGMLTSMMPWSHAFRLHAGGGWGWNDNVRGLMHSEQAQQSIHGNRDAMV